MAFSDNSGGAFFANVTPYFTSLFYASTPVRTITRGTAASNSTKSPLESINLGN